MDRGGRCGSREPLFMEIGEAFVFLTTSHLVAISHRQRQGDVVHGSSASAVQSFFTLFLLRRSCMIGCFDGCNGSSVKR